MCFLDVLIKLYASSIIMMGKKKKKKDNNYMYFKVIQSIISIEIHIQQSLVINSFLC